MAAGTYAPAGEADHAVVVLTQSVFLSGGWDPAFSSQVGFSTIDGQYALMGIQVVAGAVTITRFNVQHALGGIENRAWLTLADSIVAWNAGCCGRGGGITNLSGLTVLQSRIVHNTADAGGGIRNYSLGTALVVSSSIGFNHAGFAGGGLYSHHSGDLIVDNSTVAANTAGGEGGGIYSWACASRAEWDSGSLTLNSSTITGNWAGGSGGGIKSRCARLTLRNSLVAANIAPGAPDCDNFNAAYFVSAGNNLLGSTNGCRATFRADDLLDQEAGIGEAVGETPYVPLLPGSAAIDAGNQAGCVGSTGLLPADQRGAPRAGRCDIGAYEYTLPGPAAHIAAFAGPRQFTALLSAFPAVRAYVLDSLGSPVPGVPVVFAAPSTGPSGAFLDTGTYTTTALTNAAGVATAATFTANELIGRFRVTATAPGAGSPAVIALANLFPHY